MKALLLDMGLPRRTDADLRNQGWDVLHVGAEAMLRHSDEAIAEFALDHGRTIVTLDDDFARIVATSGRSSPSVILIRMQGLNRPRATALRPQVVSAISDDLESGCIATVTPSGIRVRQVPIR